MSSDREKLECLRVLAEVEQYVHQDKRAPERVKKILQWILDESKREERIGEYELNMRAFIDNLILKSMSGEIDFYLDNARATVLLRHEKEMNTCVIMYDRPPNEEQFNASCIKAELRNHDFHNSVSLPLNRQDKEFFFNLWLEKIRAQDHALLARFTRNLSAN